MNILYVSDLCSNTKFERIFKNSKVKPAQQAQKYHRLMVDGLYKKNNDITIKVLSPLPINRNVSTKLYFKREQEIENGIEFNYLPFINFPLLRHIWIIITGFFYIIKWCLTNKDGVVISDVLDISISSAVILVSKLTKTLSVGIVTDVPALLAGMTTNKTCLRSRVILTINSFVMNCFDSYVFLTQQMNNLINLEYKPYVVIEGQVDINMAYSANELREKHEQSVCLYAGGLYKLYGLKLLTDAFIAADIAGAELHIYGSGDFEEELKAICKEHSNIKYFGVVANDLVVKEQLKATLLINPRPTNEEYTKYSFPSKNMEYMVSGTPVLTTCLPGMPEEYKQYVYLIEDETVEGITKILKEVLSKSREELHQKGQEAKKFVLGNKNNVVQAGKIVEMLFGANDKQTPNRGN